MSPDSLECLVVISSFLEVLGYQRLLSWPCRGGFFSTWSRMLGQVIASIPFHLKYINTALNACTCCRCLTAANAVSSIFLAALTKSLLASASACRPPCCCWRCWTWTRRSQPWPRPLPSRRTRTPLQRPPPAKRWVREQQKMLHDIKGEGGDRVEQSCKRKTWANLASCCSRGRPCDLDARGFGQADRAKSAAEARSHCLKYGTPLCARRAGQCGAVLVVAHSRPSARARAAGVGLGAVPHWQERRRG